MCLDSTCCGESGEIKLRHKKGLPVWEGLLEILLKKGRLLPLQLGDGEDNRADQDDDGDGSDQYEDLVDLVALLGERLVIFGDPFGTLFEVV